MFDALINHIFLSFWTGEKKVGPNKEVQLRKTCEIYGDAVYDITWTLRYIYKNGTTSHSVNISDRANKWDLRKTIKKIEEKVLPDKIKEVIEEGKKHI